MEYKLGVILVCVFVFLIMVVFYVLNRGTIRHWTAIYNDKMLREGMTSPTRKLYRFVPDRKSGDKNGQNGIDIYADDVRRETLALMQFFKERKHLVDDAVGGPSAAEKLIESIPKMSPAVQRPQVPEIDFKSLEESLKPPEKNTPATAEKMTSPDRQGGQSLTNMREGMSSDEYGGTVIEDQEIYRVYTDMKSRETELMDELLGEYFVAKNWEKNNEGGNMSKTMAIKLEYYDTAYSKVKFHVLQTREESIFVPKIFAKYFVVLTTKYKKSDAKLKQIKQTLYNILRPTFVMQQFFAELSTNSGKFPAKTDALFFVNKCIEHLSPKLSTQTEEEKKTTELNVGPAGSVHTFKDDDQDYNNRDIMADGLSMTDSVLIASFLYRLADMNVPHFVMTKETFLRNYPVFLEKNQEKKYPGIYKFLVENVDKITQ